MAKVPKTSVSLIMDISANPESARWREMYERYNAVLCDFLASRFPGLESEADDLVQETMCALAAQLPNWKYSPLEKGAFHCYLTGILKHKAMDALRRRERDSRIRTDLALEPGGPERGAEERAWLESAMKIAVREVLSDESVNPVFRNIFRELVLSGKTPEETAAKYGKSRAAVDQIKHRMLERMRDVARRLCEFAAQ